MTRIQQGMSDPEILLELGRRLRGYREQQQLTVRQLAARASLTPLTILKAEHGENFTMRTLLRIVRALGRIDLGDGILPAPAPSPLVMLQPEGSAPRRRVRPPRHA
jgi:transcriptional regulator with XRE-family HTH domain